MVDMTAESTNSPVKPTNLYEFGSMGRLVQQACDGCDESFRRLVQLNHESVRLYLTRFIGCPHQADDLAQDTFLVAYQKLDEFRGEAKFSTWIIGIARFKAIHFLREQKALRAKNQQYLEAAPIEQKLNQLQVETDETGLARAEALKSCIGELPDQSMQLIDQFYFQEMTATSIAAMDDQASGAIRMKLLRIRKVLLRCINLKLSIQRELQ